MNQKTIRAWNNNAYSNTETDELILELLSRTTSSQHPYNSVDELATAVKSLIQNGYSLVNEGNFLKLKKGTDTTSSIDLSIYLDDTNLARITNGILDPTTFVATFTRDDNSTFTIDFSSLSDLKEVGYSNLKSEFKDYVVLTPAATVTVDLSLGQAFELTPNQNTNINFTNIQTKVVDLTLIGDGTAHGITFGIDGVYTSLDIKKIDASKDYDGTSGVEYLHELDFKKTTSPEKLRYLISTVTP